MRTFWNVPWVVLLCASCANSRVPTKVDAVISQLKCGMAPADVEKLGHSKLHAEGQRTWGTHILKQGTTDIWLQFENDGLRSVQVATLSGLMSMKLWPKIELCAGS